MSGLGRISLGARADVRFSHETIAISASGRLRQNRKLLSRCGTNARRCGWACMPRPLQRDSHGVAGALAMHLCVYCVVAACFALALYYLMQPSRLPNPGMAAHNASPRTLNYIEVLRTEREAAKRNVGLKREPETTGASTPQLPEVKPEVKRARAQSTAQNPSRKRSVRRSEPDEPPAAAEQPPSGAYRPMY
jgi:hypothetical protein